MDDRMSELAAQVAALGSSLRAVEARVAALEAGTGLPERERVEELPSGEASLPLEPPTVALPGLVALAGRCFLVLGGAFLVRAITEAGTLPKGVGVAVGVGYALVWLVLADRQRRAGLTMAANAYGVTAVAVACPLVFEATTHLSVFSPPAAAAVLLALGAAALAVAIRGSLATLAWAAELGTLATGLALLVATRSLVTFDLVLLGIAVAALGASLWKGWAGLAWPAALVADLAVFETASLAGRAEGLPEAYAGLSTGAVVCLVLALPLPFVAGMLARVLVVHRPPSAFDVLQTSAAVVISLFAAFRLGPLVGLPPGAVGAGAVAIGVVVYGTAFLTSGLDLGRAFAVLSGVGLALVVAGSRIAAGADTAALAWGAAGFAVIVFAARGGRAGLEVQGALLLGAAAFSSGLLEASLGAFLAAAGSLPRFSVTATVVLGLLLASAVTLARARVQDASRRSLRMPAFGLATLSVFALGALLVRALLLLLSVGDGAAGTAAVRSTVLALAAMALAACRSLPEASELSRLAYPALAAGGLKLLLEDLPRGRPATLFLAFALFGGALMAVPRLLRRESPSSRPGLE